MKSERLLIVFCYGLVYLVWGSTYFFIKGAVATVPAELVVALRFLGGALILAAIAWRKGAFKTAPSPAQLGGSALIGALLLLMGNGLITFAEKTVPSYAVSLIAACSPLFIALFNILLFKTTISAIRFSGVLVGVAGIALLLYDGTSIAGSLQPGVLMGILAWSFGTSIARVLPKIPDVFLSTAVQMIAAGGTALVIALVRDPASLAGLGSASAWSVASIVYLAVLGSLTLVAYNVLLVKEPSFRISSYALVNPLIAVFLGLVVSGESATPLLVFGVPLVLCGLVLMLYGDPLLQKLVSAARRSPR
jgi:drug/metabolite transporter (DMT)-like permease